MPSRLLTGLVAVALGRSAVAQAPAVERVRPNDNRARAGVTANRAVAVRMEARLAMWHPDGDDRPGVPIPVFAELGRPAQVPGPLIRAPGGTDVILMLRNQIPNATLTVHGLHARPAVNADSSHSVTLAPGAVHTLRFRLDRPGTYYYWGTTTGSAFGARTGDDAQLNGVIVVDEPGERTPRDRIFVISMWTDTAWSDSTRRRQRELVVLNGRSWPAGDRVQYEKGEVARWRVVNLSVDAHAMHLHGFPYRVTRRGDGAADTALGPRAELAFTERVAPGGTYSATWVAERLGTWLFHCEDPGHSEARGPLGTPSGSASAGALRGSPGGLGGLVTAVEIRPAEGDTSWKIAPPPPPTPARRFRMLLRGNPGGTPAAPFYGISVEDVGIEALPPDSGQRVGPTVVLNRAEPVSVWVVNGLPEPTSIHWHGIDGESVMDGVPSVSGIKPNLTPLLAPGDSTEVRLTPPRAGTFAYHAMSSLTRQWRAGLVGALVVGERGKYDGATSVPVLVSSPADSAAEETSVLFNGNLTPAPLELRRAVSYRLRMMNFTAGRPDLVLELLQDSTYATWRPVARDGAELAPADRVLQPARQWLTVGQTRDVEFSPLRAGDWRLEARTPAGLLLGVLPIRVY